MPWVKIDEAFPRHPKVAAAGPIGMALQIAALCYSNEYLTDGFIPKRIAKTLLDLDGIAMHCWSNGIFGNGEDATAELVIQDVINAGLWIEEDGGYRIHDYHDFQPSKAEVLELRKARSAAGQKGAKARWNGAS